MASAHPDNVEAFVPRVRLPRGRRMRSAFRAGETTYYPYLDEVIWIAAKRNYSQVNAKGSSFTVREILASLERRLAPHGFMRVQRSTIINLEHVTEIRRERRGRYAIVISDGTTIIVPAAMKEQLEQLLTSD